MVYNTDGLGQYSSWSLATVLLSRLFCLKYLSSHVYEGKTYQHSDVSERSRRRGRLNLVHCTLLPSACAFLPKTSLHRSVDMSQLSCALGASACLETDDRGNSSAVLKAVGLDAGVHNVGHVHELGEEDVAGQAALRYLRCYSQEGVKGLKRHSAWRARARVGLAASANSFEHYNQLHIASSAEGGNAGFCGIELTVV
ncbi:hypothetical protein cyc_05168 [Cyclospora cayetanensis]|uniref:Uncharacterized protein n=1 Tax=Cyclospora cayetanensis TaxID=88456 RepID=A0A1D3DA95_9EIME|nr:hypothetical protein cyc_05168 [Cyclospora cayetanensis]